jgi:hypothetical protein
MLGRRALEALVVAFHDRKNDDHEEKTDVDMDRMHV